MTNCIQLDWQGPYRWNRSGAQALPDATSGIYVWTIATPTERLLVYVGESGALCSRWAAHVTMLLGGFYKVYDPTPLRNGQKLKELYACRNTDSRLRDFDRSMANAAQDNLALYDWFWASCTGDPKLRQSVESAILDVVKKTPNAGRMIQNDRQKPHSNANAVRIRSLSPAGISVNGIPEVVDYGALDP